MKVFRGEFKALHALNLITKRHNNHNARRAEQLTCTLCPSFKGSIRTYCTLTGFAYKTIPGKPIVAGATLPENGGDEHNFAHASITKAIPHTRNQQHWDSFPWIIWTMVWR